MEIRLKNCSFLLAGSGSNGVLIDNDITFHKSGLPFIPARRIKGLLRDSMMEVLEMTGTSDYNLVEFLFGSEGDAKKNSGRIRIENGYLNNWNDIINELENSPKTINKESIIEYFTTEVSQTTIDENSGTTKKRSLRNYRVLNPGFEFIFPVSFKEPLNQTENNCLEKTILNLRYMGTRRNRGFGKIKCTYNNSEIKTNEEKANSSSGFKTRELPSTYKLKITAHNIEPIILSKTDSDQNTVNSYSCISGNQLRGILVNQYIKANNGKIKNDDPLFWELFLSGKICFGNLTYKGTQSIPLNIHYEKDNQNNIRDVFAITENEKVITKPITGYGRISTNSSEIKVTKESPDFSSQFHVSRYGNRAAGTSTADVGSIFYYTALSERQTFSGYITGNKDSLDKLLEFLPKKLEAFIGKSKSAQYGKIELFFEIDTNPINTQTPPENKLYLYFNSPVILINPWGFPEPSESLLKAYLKEILSPKEEGFIEITNRATSIIQIEQFNVAWNAKTEKIPAFDAGSVFELCLKKALDSDAFNTLLKSGIGEVRNVGYGKVKVESVNGDKSYKWYKPEINEKQNDPDREPKQPLVKNILEYVKLHEENDEIKTRAIQDALDFKKNFNNHLLGIMIEVFKEAKNAIETMKEYDYVKAWLKKAGKIDENTQSKKKKEPKPAFKSLVNAHLIDKDNLEHSELLKKFSGNFDNGFIYWKTFFQTCQKLNKKKESNG